MKRHDLVIQQKIKVAQKLLADLDNKLDNIHRYIIQKRKEYQYTLTNIGNMDETPMCFDMVENHTVDTKGAKTVLVKMIGCEKTCFTTIRKIRLVLDNQRNIRPCLPTPQKPCHR